MIDWERCKCTGQVPEFWFRELVNFYENYKLYLEYVGVRTLIGENGQFGFKILNLIYSWETHMAMFGRKV